MKRCEGRRRRAEDEDDGVGALVHVDDGGVEQHDGVLAVALAQRREGRRAQLERRGRAMPLIDVHALRDDLMQLSWVKEARVSRQWPDRLVVDVVERVPHAALRGADGHFTLVDETGHHLEDVATSRGYPVIAGVGVESQVGALGALLAAAPALRHQVAEAEWLGNRRWNLTFRSGQVLALPEGADRAAQALDTFARLDGTNRLLGGRVASFDMRAADRIYFRVPGRSAGALETPAQRVN